jgi:hypothetical protein
VATTTVGIRRAGMAPVGTGADGAGAPASDGEAAGVGTDGCGAVAGIAGVGTPVAGIAGVGTTKNASNALRQDVAGRSSRWMGVDVDRSGISAGDDRAEPVWG